FAPDFLPPQTVLHDCSVVGDAVYVDGGVQIVLTSVRELEAAGISLQLLRNPVPEGEPLRMNLSVQEPLRLQFRLHDAAGKLLWERTHPLSAGENTLELPLPPQAGLYLLQVQDETGRSGTLKVLRR
ncbi:MAG: T9SS C-terminal target domain-containing protein, partial [Bacteroidetes bacterium]